MKKRKLIFLCFLLALLCGCSSGERQTITSIQQLNDKACVVGAAEGGASMFAVEEFLPEAQMQLYSDNVTAYTAVQQGKLDAFAYDRIMMEFAIAGGLDGVKLLDESLGEPTDIAVGISPKTEIPNLTQKINQFLEELREDGTLDDMYDRWVSKADNQMPDIPTAQNPRYHLRIGTTGLVQPFSYYEGTTITGYDIELIYRFAYWLGADVQISIYDYGGIVAAAESGDIDCIMADLNATPERREKLEFSDGYLLSETTVMVKDDAAAAAQSYQKEEGDGFWASVKESFEKTFIRESRWRLIASGIETTVMISVLAAIMGSILGFGLCLMKISKYPVARGFARVYVRVMQGTPMVVLLMILFYIVFAGSGLSGVWVAVIGFGLNLAAYVCEMIRTGIQSVDIGQTEAALALGFTGPRAFFQIVMPQATKQFLPVFKGELVSLIKLTSVVGYIAVQDLTKMSDIIRSRTFEAFFPLISTAIIYFIIAWALTSLLIPIERKVTPDRKKRKIKGVKLP